MRYKSSDPNRPKCKADGCEKPFVAREYCQTHYITIYKKNQTEERCKVDGCKRGAYSSGYCHSHYIGKYKKYQEKYAVKISAKRIKARDKLFDILGGAKCANCGYDKDERALNFDHIEDDGNTERKNLNPASMPAYYIQNPKLAREKLQVLCANCNHIKKYESGHLQKREKINAEAKLKLNSDDASIKFNSKKGRPLSASWRHTD